MSTENKSLKFIHLGSNVAATDKVEGYATGSIIFEPKSGRIAVQGTDNLEYYGGGRVSDATFDSKTKILTISFNNGDPAIKLDFSDTASAEGVNAIMKAHADRIKALEATVNGAEGVVGLVTKVATNTSDIAAINNPTTGILAEAKKYADGLAKNYDAAGAAAQALVDAKAYTDTEIGKVNTTTTGLRTDVDALKRTVGNASSGLVKDVADNKVAIAGNKAAIDAINNPTTGILAEAKKYTDGKIGDIGDGTVQTYVEGKVSIINGVTDGLRSDLGTRGDGKGTAFARIESLEGTVSDHGTKITTLIGEDANKSVRVISAEEVAKVVAGAPASYDTLKEIADWIANDTTGSTQMANDIKDLKTAVGKPAGDNTEATGLYKDIADNKSAINVNAGAIAALKKLHVGDKTVAQEVTDGIAGIVEHSETNDKESPKTADVVVTVTTKAGSVSGVAVDASILANKVKANSNAITAEVTRAKGKEDELRNDLGTKLETEGNAFTRIKALEDAQASGSLMWSVWE